MSARADETNNSSVCDSEEQVRPSEEDVWRGRYDGAILQCMLVAEKTETTVGWVIVHYRRCRGQAGEVLERDMAR